MKAAESLYGFWLRKEEYEKAESYLAYVSDQNPEKKRKQALIYSKTGRVKEAYRAYEELLFSAYGSLNMVFGGYLSAGCTTGRQAEGSYDRGEMESDSEGIGQRQVS